MQIIVTNVGHGNCIGIFQNERGLVVDYGAQSVFKHQRETRIIEDGLSQTISKDLIITHYHWDHYNLLSHLPRHYFENVYMPALPPQTNAGSAILKALAFFTLLRYDYYPLIPEILRVTRSPNPLIRGKVFSTLNSTWKTEWPDYSVVDRIHRSKIKRLKASISRARQNLSERDQQRFERIYRDFSLAFSEGAEYVEETFVRESSNRSTYLSEQKSKLHIQLKEIEKIFREVTNAASLVARNNLFLFTGDISNKVLDKYLQFNDQSYFFIEAPHHGTHYGKGLNRLETDILTISRGLRDQIKPRLLQKVRWKVLVDTARHGTCSVETSSTSRCIIQEYDKSPIIFF